MRIHFLPGPVSLFDRVVVQQGWYILSALGLCLLSDVFPGNIGNLEFTLHGSQAVILLQSLWRHFLFLRQLHFNNHSNWIPASAFFSYIFIVQFLIQYNRCQLSTCSIEFYWLSYSCMALGSLQSVSGVVVDTSNICEYLKMSQAITHVLVGIFTLRTFAIYHNNRVILFVLAILGFSRIVMYLVRIATLGSYLPVCLMKSPRSVASSRSLLRFCPLHSHNLGLVIGLLLKLITGIVYCWHISSSAYATYLGEIADVSNHWLASMYRGTYEAVFSYCCWMYFGGYLWCYGTCSHHCQNMATLQGVESNHKWLVEKSLSCTAPWWFVLICSIILMWFVSDLCLNRNSLLHVSQK